MATYCLRLDRSLNDDERYNKGCTDEWGVYHLCKGCPYNRYMGDNNSNCLTNENYGSN